MTLASGSGERSFAEPADVFPAKTLLLTVRLEKFGAAELAKKIAPPPPWTVEFPAKVQL